MNKIEEVARQLCEADGLNPDAKVAAGVSEVATAAERAEMLTVPDVLLYVPRWHTYRDAASGAINPRKGD